MKEEQLEHNIDWSFLTSPEFLDSIAKIFESLAWPLAAVLIILSLKSTIKKVTLKLCDRLKKVGKDGLEFTPGINQIAQSKNLNHEDVEKSHIKKKLLDLTLGQAPIIKEYMNIFSSNIEDGIKESGLDREDFLKAKAVEGFLAWSFERIYNNIFGSQINALQFLIDNTGKVNEESIKVFYNKAKEKNPEFYDSYSYIDWLNFLKVNNLIILNEGIIEATIESESFIIYLAHHNLYTNKIL